MASPMIELIKSLHENMEAEVLVSGSIEVNNGLRQGCTIAPTLFNLYFNLVVESWRERCRSMGVEVLYKCSGKLVGARTRRPLRTKVSELLFADDAVAVATTRESIELAVEALLEVTSQWGLTVSIPKTKLMVTGAEVEEADLLPIQVGSQSIKAVMEFKYLGAVIDSSASIEREVCERIGRASRVFGRLRKPVFMDKDLSLQTKSLVYTAAVLGALLYGAET